MDNRESALVRFGRFLLDLRRRELLADGVPVLIGSRAFDVLAVLVEGGGQLVTKNDLMSLVWPGAIVEDNTLQFHISAIRKALGPDRGMLKTASGRGYRFIAEIAMDAGPDAAPFARHGESPSSTGLPMAMTDLAGHEAHLAGFTYIVSPPQLVALLGDNGIVGTRPGTKSGPGLHTSPAVAAVFQLSEDERDTVEGAAAALASRRLVLLLSIGALTFGRQCCAAPKPASVSLSVHPGRSCVPCREAAPEGMKKSALWAPAPDQKVSRVEREEAGWTVSVDSQGSASCPVCGTAHMSDLFRSSPRKGHQSLSEPDEPLAQP